MGMQIGSGAIEVRSSKIIACGNSSTQDVPCSQKNFEELRGVQYTCRLIRVVERMMSRGLWLKLPAVCPGIAIVLTATLAIAQSPPGNLSPRDFDLACAVVAGVEIGASQKEKIIPRRDMAVTIFTFYLGRLSGRDDTKDWNAIVRGRIAELQEAVRSPKLVDTCLDFYMYKIK